jgi:uncharacterized coiled-coil protein SlyX
MAEDIESLKQRISTLEQQMAMMQRSLQDFDTFVAASLQQVQAQVGMDGPLSSDIRAIVGKLDDMEATVSSALSYTGDARVIQSVVDSVAEIRRALNINQ